MSGKTTVGKKGGFAAQGISPVILVSSSSPCIKAILVSRVAAIFQMGNGPEVVAEDVVNGPTAFSYFFGKSNGRVSIAPDPTAPIPFPKKGKTLLQFFKERNCKFNKSLKEATLASSFFYEFLRYKRFNQYPSLPLNFLTK
jgi:hypothetical protein